MKTRIGFVSNSSSSSFIVAVDPKDSGKIKIEIEINLDEYGHRIKTMQEVLDWKEEYCVENDDSRLLKMIAAIESGKEIITGHFADDTGDATELILCNAGIPKDTKNVEIIESEGGY